MRTNRILLTLGLLIAASASAASATVVFDETFDYADTAALESVWTKANGSSGSIVTEVTVETVTPTTAPVPASAPMFKLPNGLYYDELDQTITGDWTLSVSLLHTRYSRSQMVLLVNAAGTQGYGVEWGGAGQPTQFSGEGYLRIRKLDLSEEWDAWNDTIDIIGGTGGHTEHAVTGYAYLGTDGTSGEYIYSTDFEGLGDVQLTFDAETGTLTTYMDGVQTNQETDGDFSSFSRVYVRGNSSGYFDDISIDAVVPEPGTLGLLAVGSLLMIKRRRA